MIRILYWNINQSVKAELLSAICKERGIDLMFLAENHHDDRILLPSLMDQTDRAYINISNLPNRLKAYSAMPIGSVQKVSDSKWLTIKHISPPVGASILVAAIHFASKMFKDEGSQSMRMPRIREAIDKAEAEYGHTRTLVLGDFNQNPFELGMTDADGLHAVKTKAISLREQHKADDETRKYFYNPMWSLMGDKSEGPAGTYYTQSCEKFHYWHSFDQVLLRPALLSNHKFKDVEVIDHIGDVSLILDDKIDAKISDHLPIAVNIREMKVKEL